ncbi:PLP-dependent transferase [Haloprofundus sp. MHR1]|uniref:PLP-dependent transferase n=1 Tax=Haloprofundus sp. MHR1 TaxID=2572921 RepID=UPI0037427E56
MANRQMSGYGGVLSVELDADLNGTAEFLGHLSEFLARGEPSAALESLIEHPATMTHSPLSQAERDELRHLELADSNLGRRRARRRPPLGTWRPASRRWRRTRRREATRRRRWTTTDSVRFAVSLSRFVLPSRFPVSFSRLDFPLRFPRGHSSVPTSFRP